MLSLMVSLLALTAVGAEGEVLMYYRDGNDIVVKNCGLNTAVISTPQACATVGQANRVPVASFKRALLSEFSVVDTDESDARLDQIKAFIQGYGDDSKSSPGKAQVQKLLHEVLANRDGPEKNGAPLQNLNKLVQSLVDKRIAPSAITSVNSTREGDQEMFGFLKQFDASRSECGTDDLLNATPDQGPAGPPAVEPRRSTWLMNLWVSVALADVPGGLGARMNDCLNRLGKESTKTSNGVMWKLVARKRDRSTGKYYEVWQDTKTLTLWGDTLDSSYSHYNAVEMALNGKVVAQKACVSGEGKRADAGITGKDFAVPTIEAWDDAVKDGLRAVLPNMGHDFWSASPNPNVPTGARNYDGKVSDSSTLLSYRSREQELSVRCVAN